MNGPKNHPMEIYFTALKSFNARAKDTPISCFI